MFTVDQAIDWLTQALVLGVVVGCVSAFSRERG